MPVTKLKIKRRARTKELFEQLHGVSLAEVAARAAFPPRVKDSKKDLPKLTVVEEEPVEDAELIDNTGDVGAGTPFDGPQAAGANPSRV